MMCPEKVIFCKFCGNTHSLSNVCDEKEAVNNNRPPNGEGSVTVSRKDEANRADGEFMEPDGNAPGSNDPPTQPFTHPSTDTHDDISKSNVVTKTMGPGYPEVIRGASQIGSFSNDSDHSCTHNKDKKIDQVASQIEKSNQDNGPETTVPESWEELQNELPPVTGPVSSRPLEETTCVDGSNRNNAASFISAKNAETTLGCNDALEPSNKDDPPILKDVYVSSPISKANESLEATATVVATKLSSRKADKGPP